MEAIRTYLDNVFAGFPPTQRVRQLKQEMLAGMEEKYNELKSGGMSEHEAVGSVIADFGSIDEIAAELGIEQSTAELREGLYVSREEADAYFRQSQKSSFWIGLGVWLILAGVAAMILISGLASGENERIAAAGIFVLFLSVAVAVPIFIVTGMRFENFAEYTKKPVRLDVQTKGELEQEYSRLIMGFAIKIAAGVALILLAVGAFIFFGTLGGSEMSQVTALAGMLLVIGFAVFLFVRAGMVKSAYDALLNRGDFADKVNYNKSERLIGAIASVYWSVAVAAYLLWSFLGDAWEISWVIWPVAGVLFGAICGGISVWFNSKNS
jgi:hypothetical protein